MTPDDETQRELRRVMFVGGKASVGVGAWMCSAKHGEVSMGIGRRAAVHRELWQLQRSGPRRALYKVVHQRCTKSDNALVVVRVGCVIACVWRAG